MLLKIGVIDIIKLYAFIFSTLCCLQNTVISVARATKYESSLLSFLHPPVTPTPLYLCLKSFSILFLNILLSLWHSLNPLNPELNPICYLLALLAHQFLHVSRIMVKSLTLRLLMSYIYGAHILDVS